MKTLKNDNFKGYIIENGRSTYVGITNNKLQKRQL